MTATDAVGRRWAAHLWRARGVSACSSTPFPSASRSRSCRSRARSWSRPRASLWLFLAWWLGISLGATLVVSGVYLVSRRLLPLVLVFQLSREAPTVQEAAEILIQLVGALSAHDRITRGHAERVRAYSATLGRQLGLPDEDLDRLN
ncbi:MAG TPA: hypothetical protein VNJ53_06670 [Gaiellaceae bacterium]|nr:hypothetical protein [Gaiellaceae bacterium]